MSAEDVVAVIGWITIAGSVLLSFVLVGIWFKFESSEAYPTAKQRRVTTAFVALESLIAGGAFSIGLSAILTILQTEYLTFLAVWIGYTSLTFLAAFVAGIVAAKKILGHH